MKRPVLTLAAVVLAASACSLQGEDAPAPPPLPTASSPTGPTATESPGTRLPIAPRLIVQNVAFGKSKAQVDRAIRDLKTIGVWEKLTGHLYVVKVASRPGAHEVPDDRHLADAYLRGYIDDEGQGAMCDILFFPTALEQDLANWRAYHAAGRYPDPPPTLRQYWAAILGHELSHCLGHGRGEEVAQDWEARVLRLLREAALE